MIAIRGELHLGIALMLFRSLRGTSYLKLRPFMLARHHNVNLFACLVVCKDCRRSWIRVEVTTSKQVGDTAVISVEMSEED